MIVFCLTRSPLEVNENFSAYFVKVVEAGLPVFISAMPMAGISAPFCYNGVLAMTHAEVLFGICAAQLLNPGLICIHAGFPSIADPRIEYNPNYGLISHHLLNILMATSISCWIYPHFRVQAPPMRNIQQIRLIKMPGWDRPCA